MPQPFKPTLRERKRYVLYTPTQDNEVINAFKELFGIHGAASAGIIPITHNAQTSILRVAHTHTDALKAAIAWSGARSILTSGNLKKVKLHTIQE